MFTLSPQLGQETFDEQNSLWASCDLGFINKLKALSKRSKTKLHLSSGEQLHENCESVGTRVSEPFRIFTDALIQRHSSGPEFRVIG